VFVILDYKFTRSAFSNSGDDKDNLSSGYAVKGFCSPTIFWIWLVVPLVLFSVAKTKLPWYINTVYPAVAVLLARFLVDTLRIWEIYGRKWKVPLQAFIILAFLCVFVIAEMRIFTHIIEQTTTATKPKPC
jgi:4-amino-4-deoxy-L-arabinose transferase-like glycosyltransferase